MSDTLFWHMGYTGNLLIVTDMDNTVWIDKEDFKKILEFIKQEKPEWLDEKEAE